MKRPWNAVNHPVYSLCTKQADTYNMNVCTYVMPITMQPKRYAIAIYQNTKTLANIQDSDYCVLQFLSTTQSKLVNVLGKKTGNSYNKQNYLQKKQMLTQWNDFLVLTDAMAYVLLKKINCENTGDHHLYWFEVLQYKTNKDKKSLMFHQLIDEKIILG
jgi:flavin reductase (DIM6/NTAB) family NADH-FMN oxidoreductase RutF